MKVRGLILIFFCFGIYSVISQDIAYNGDPDKSFSTARTMAFAGDYPGARDTLTLILSKYPEYTEVEDFLARTYSWDGRYNEARKHFNRIISREKEYKEVWLAAVRNELFADNTHIALGLVNKSLIYLPGNAELLSLQQQVLHQIKGEQSGEMAGTVPKETEENKTKNRVTVGNAIDVFDVTYDPMVYASVAYTRETSFGKLIPRINYSNRFNTNGWQYELDFYPRFSKTLYGYLNYGYSDDVIYPQHRGGAELYMNLPKSWEVSAGMRYLAFSSGATTIVTGSVGLYRGNYYLSFRPYITPVGETTGFSGNLLGRRYFKHKENYLGINLGIGYAPELRQLSANNVLLAETLFFVASQQLRLEYQFTTKDKAHLYRANMGVTRQEFVSVPDTYFWALTAGMQYEIRF